MNLKELKEIIDIFSSKESLEELEFERSGVRLRIRRVSNQLVPATVIPTVSMPVAAPVAVAQAPAEPPRAVEDALYYIKSPIVGTFYKSPSPNAEPFVSTGDFVEKGAVVCIIEAMKLMNEIESDVAGEIVSVLVENGQPVEYGERLFAIRPR
jgi:acetyl-CoA carboxylase biotin carboxyl carrier protein